MGKRYEAGCELRVALSADHAGGGFDRVVGGGGEREVAACVGVGHRLVQLCSSVVS